MTKNCYGYLNNTECDQCKEFENCILESNELEIKNELNLRELKTENDLYFINCNKAEYEIFTSWLEVDKFISDNKKEYRGCYYMSFSTYGYQMENNKIKLYYKGVSSAT